MKYDLQINQNNIKPHLDIERDIQTMGNGLFTFNIRVNSGNIVDHEQFRTITISQYRNITTVKEEPDPPCDIGERSEAHAVRPDKR
jgi:hypothetical protein